MQNYLRYINLSWAVVGICKNARQPLLSCIPGIDNDEAAAVEHYVIGYMAFWRQKIDRYIADHPPVETFPRFYLVLLRQPIAPMESDGMSRVYQM